MLYGIFYAIVLVVGYVAWMMDFAFFDTIFFVYFISEVFLKHTNHPNRVRVRGSFPFPFPSLPFQIGRAHV